MINNSSFSLHSRVRASLIIAVSCVYFVFCVIMCNIFAFKRYSGGNFSSLNITYLLFSNVRLTSFPRNVQPRCPWAVGQMSVQGTTDIGPEYQAGTQDRDSLNLWSAECQGHHQRQHRTENRQRTHLTPGYILKSLTTETRTRAAAPCRVGKQEFYLQRHND